MPVPRPVRADMHIIRIAFLRASFAARSGAKGKPQPADGRSCALFHCTFRIISSDEFPVHAEAYSHENRKHKYEYGCKDVFLHHLPPSRFKLFGKAQTIAPRGMPALRPAWADMCVIRIAFLYAIFACPLPDYLQTAKRLPALSYDQREQHKQTPWKCCIRSTCAIPIAHVGFRAAIPLYRFTAISTSHIRLENIDNIPDKPGLSHPA